MNVKHSKDASPHTYVYLAEDYYKNPKEFFKFTGQLIKNRIKEEKSSSTLDIGCSRGELLYYLKGQKIGNAWAGVDYSETMIEMAKKFPGLSGVNFYCGKAEEIDLKKKFDFVVMAGVTSFFDYVAVPLANLAKHLKAGGRAFVMSAFNPHDVDVLIKYRNLHIGREYHDG